MPERAERQRAFLEAQGLAGATVAPLDGDASFRHYFRVEDGTKTRVLMDAAGEPEAIDPFLQIARHLLSLGYSAPEIFAVDEAAGLLLLEDLGRATYTRMLARGDMEETLYALAIDLLADLHGRPLAEAVPPELPAYTDQRFLDEALLFTDWFLPAMTGEATPAVVRESFAVLWPPLLDLAREVPESLVLRDYHVDNLVWLSTREGVRACGLLDFQDAVRGPVAYDVVSLLEDARRDLAPGLADRMRERYLKRFPKLDAQAFARSLAILGAQRHCKVIGIFTRLFRRDGKPAYLDHLPRVWRLLEGNVAEPALAPLAAWLDVHVPPALRCAPAPEDLAP
ncbi:MAG: phosphotransferase [Alphaproteobacteria bacterium]|nr:phosphotransferase [Alphaproteobacteria bacterium]